VATNSVLAKLAVQISANTAEFNKALSATQKNLQSFTGNIGKLAGAVGVAFTGREIARFALDVSRLAGEAQGVREAFEKLPSSTKLMMDLKKATGNTVSELELMKRAVMASNFDISLEALPRLLEFATVRAKQTGQSVDYLVDSIVTGIGRKSKLILDNLGISAVQLTEALGGASTASSSIGEVADAVGKIAEKSLQQMGTISDNTATKLDRLSASWNNVKVAIGDAANSTGFLGNSVDALTGSLDLLASRDLTFWKAIQALFSGPSASASAAVDAYVKQLERINREKERSKFIVEQVDKAYKQFNGNLDEFVKHIAPNHVNKQKLIEEFQKRINKENEAQIETYESLKQKIDELNQQFETATSLNDKKELANIGAKIIAYNKQLEALDKLRKAQKDSLEGKLKFIPDLEAEGSTNLELRNDQARNEAKEFAKELEEATQSMGGAMIKLEETSEETTTNIATQWLDMSGAIAGSITSVADSLGQALVGVGDFGDSIIKALAGFARQIGETLIAIGVGMLAARIAIKNPATAIAAGVALVALSGAMSAGMQRAQQNFNSGSGGSAPGYTPSQKMELNVGVRGRIRGSDLDLISEKYDYGRNRVG
jgi:hypothetical protein